MTFHKLSKDSRIIISVDDLGIVYIPNIYCNYKKQLIDVEQKMNKD